MKEKEERSNESSLREQLEALLARVEEQERRLKELESRNQELEEENERLRELLDGKGKAKGAKAPLFKEDYSVETNKRKPKRRGKSTGRRKTSEKLKDVSKTVEVYEENVNRGDCVEHRRQYVWRIEGGSAKYVCYCLYALPTSQSLPEIVGVRNSRSGYGIEVILMVAFLHYWIGISLEHVCDVVRFFTGLELSSAQANSLLEQLSRDWKEEYDTIAELLANQLIIYIDETGWKVGKKSCYTWVFSTTMHVLFRCGVGRGKAEAEAVVGEKFEGIGVTDDYGAYKYLFSEHQLCWAHLLRKAIKLMLQNPDEVAYREFLDELYDIYQQAVRWQKDQRLTVGRAEKVNQLQEQIRTLCKRGKEVIDSDSMSHDEQTFLRLQRELLNGIDALFVFVAHPEVEPTNNRSERNLRREAEVRKGARTSKTPRGAERRSIIMTVLASLNSRFERFTLEHLLDEVNGWLEQRLSVFQLELSQMTLAQPPPPS